MGQLKETPMLAPPAPEYPLDVDGWPIRLGMRIRVRGTAARPGGVETTSRLGEVLETRWTGHGWVIRFREEESESPFHFTVPERVRVRGQTKLEREEMRLRLHRQRVKAEEDVERARLVAERARR